MNFRIYQVDAFTKEPFKGNPASVCIQDSEISDIEMQRIANEMNLSETAFIESYNKKDFSKEKKFKLRWFTPKQEVPLCGHATLASSKVIFDELKNQNSRIEFITKSGTLYAEKKDDLILLDFPMFKPKTIEWNPELNKYLGFDDILNTYYEPETKKLLIQVENNDSLINFKPNFSNLLELTIENRVKGLIITALGYKDIDFISRYFAPWVGVNEDPVTGAAHTVLFPFWSEILGKKELTAFQASERGGTLYLKEKSPERLSIGGNAVVVLKGELVF